MLIIIINSLMNMQQEVGLYGKIQHKNNSIQHTEQQLMALNTIRMQNFWETELYQHGQIRLETIILLLIHMMICLVRVIPTSIKQSLMEENIHNGIIYISLIVESRDRPYRYHFSLERKKLENSIMLTIIYHPSTRSLQEKIPSTQHIMDLLEISNSGLARVHSILNLFHQLNLNYQRNQQLKLRLHYHPHQQRHQKNSQNQNVRRELIKSLTLQLTILNHQLISQLKEIN